MKKGTIFLPLLGLLALSGCVVHTGSDWNVAWDFDDDDNWEQHQLDNRQALSNLVIGDNRAIVIEKMGEPDFSESFSEAGKNYQVFYYRTHKTKGDGKTTKDETTPVVFIENSLIGWGEQALDQAININQN